MICCHPYSADATLHFSFSCATQSMASTATFQKLKLKRHTMDRIDGIQFFPSPIVIDGRSSCKLRKQDLWQPILASSSCNINWERVLKAQCDSATAIMFFFLLAISCLLPTSFSSPHTPVVDPHPHHHHHHQPPPPPSNPCLHNGPCGIDAHCKPIAHGEAAACACPAGWTGEPTSRCYKIIIIIITNLFIVIILVIMIIMH